MKMSFGKTPGLEGRYFSAITFRILILPFLGLIVGLVVATTVTTLINIITQFVESEFEVNMWIFLGFFAFGFILTIQSGSGTFSVPNEHVAMLTIFGQRIDWYLKEGNYPEFTKGSILGITRAVKKGFTTDASHPNGPGFINMGILPFQIWNDRNDKKQTLENIARNSSTVFATLLLEVKVYHPRKVLNSEDPLLSLAERARTAFRTAISFFIDRDNASVKTILVKLMAGQGIVTSFVNKSDGANFNQGAMVKNHGGTAMYLPVKDRDDEETEEAFKARIDQAKKEFFNKLQEEADDVLFKNLPKKAGEVEVEYKSVEESLDSVLKSIGTKLLDASVSNIQFSDEVRGEANQASSEHFKDKSMKDSARSQADSEEILGERRQKAKDSGIAVDQFDRAVIAAQDNPESVKIYHSSGDSSSIIKAAAIVADKEES